MQKSVLIQQWLSMAPWNWRRWKKSPRNHPNHISKPEKKEGATTEELELTAEAKTILTALRWLAAEGYVIEFPDTCLVIGKQPRPQESASAGKKVTEEKKAEAPEKAEEKSPETEGEKEKSTQTPDAGEVPQ